MENTVIKTSEAFIYVGKHSDTNLYGKNSITGNGFYNTIQVTITKNRLRADIFVQTAEFVSEMRKKYGVESKTPKAIIDKINSKLKNYNV